MKAASRYDAWRTAEAYDLYMGRWSRRIAHVFLEWLAAPGHMDWLDVGCGTGALSGAILEACDPRSVTAIDPSESFVRFTGSRYANTNLRARTANAMDLPYRARSFDLVGSALVVNFLPDPSAALGEMRRVLRPGGVLGFYVWDYPGGGMGMLDAFWKAAAALDPEAATLDESTRFPLCTREGLVALTRKAGLAAEIAPLETVTEFPNFEAFWEPFTLGAGPAPGYCTSLPDRRREELKSLLASRLGTGTPIRLPARAWGVRARL